MLLCLIFLALSVFIAVSHFKEAMIYRPIKFSITNSAPGVCSMVWHYYRDCIFECTSFGVFFLLFLFCFGKLWSPHFLNLKWSGRGDSWLVGLNVIFENDPENWEPYVRSVSVSVNYCKGKSSFWKRRYFFGSL